jgi:hypothetical protein
VDVAAARVYPNPAANGETLMIEVAASETFKGTVALLDNTGRLVVAFDRTFAAGANTDDISLSGFAPGVYLLRITSAEGVNFSRKVVVM